MTPITRKSDVTGSQTAFEDALKLFGSIRALLWQEVSVLQESEAKEAVSGKPPEALQGNLALYQKALIQLAERENDVRKRMETQSIASGGGTLDLEAARAEICARLMRYASN